MTHAPAPLELITATGRHADDGGALLFVVAMLLVGLAGWRWVREWEQE